MPLPTNHLTDEARAKIEHLRSVMESAKTSIDAIMSDPDSRAYNPDANITMQPAENTIPPQSGDIAGFDRRLRVPGSHPEIKLTPDGAFFEDKVKGNNVHLFQTNPMKTLKQRLDNMSELTYQAKVFKADEGMVVVMAVGEYPVCIAADMEEAKAIIDALAAHAGED